ncbi:MAG: hypothetical protein RL685_6219 [Pseudomonadota bacterium]|jgi:hypothetical protein
MQRWIQRAASGVAGCWLAWAGAVEARSATATTDTPPPSSAGAAASSSADGLVTLARDLTLAVSEDGPNQPWTVTLANRGSEPLGFIADPGLLWFDVARPGRAPQSCVLPEPLRPTAVQRKSVLVLQPGEQYSRRLDPRFFCFAELGQLLLVPGAKVTPHFGWQLRTVTSTAKGSANARRASATAALSNRADAAPFVAWRLGANVGSPPPPPSASEPSSDEPLEGEAPPSGPSSVWRLPSEGLKSVQGATLELPASYSVWGVGSAARGANRDIELLMLAGSDAEDERSATVSFGVLNTLDRSQQIFVRRELLSYDVQGPDGFFECPSTDVGSPDFASFSTLPPHGAERAIVRLIEVCPRRSFARPGLYEVHARLAAKWSGQDLGLDAFVGQLEVTRPAFVRVRSGDRSSFARLVVPPVTAGPGVVPPGQLDAAPAEGAEPARAPDEAPAEPEAPNVDDSPAAPEQQPTLPVPPPVE